MPTAVPRDAARIRDSAPLLRIVGARKRFGRLAALDGVSFEVYPGEIFGIVGESGSGKSTLLRLLDLELMADAGSYHLDAPETRGVDLFALDEYARHSLRVAHIGIVYQQPHLGLRMRHTSSGNVVERLILSGERRFVTLRDAAGRALAASDFPLARMDDPPHVLSGGMQQRVQLAKAIARQPSLILLDEPTSGLDVSVQALVLDTLKQLQRTLHVSMILVSHDLGVIRTLADRVAVMQGGRIVEDGLTDQVLEDPLHPYAQQLVHAKL
jgi:putative phosphonate transport system ATP-binding protein